MTVPFERIADNVSEIYEICGIKAVYIDLRIDRSTLPEGVYAYDVRDTSDDDGCYIGRIEDSVIVNHAGTMLSRKPLRMLHPDIGTGGVYAVLDDGGDDWSLTGETCRVGDFLAGKAECDAGSCSH